MPTHPLQTADKRLSHTDELLRLLREASLQEPSPYIREQLEAMGSLQCSTPFLRWRQTLQHHWQWAVPVAALAVMVIMIFLPLHPQVAGLDLQVTPPGLPPALAPATDFSSPQVSETSNQTPGAKKSTRAPGAAPKAKPMDRLTVPLPYSNPDISTGTSTVVRVAMPQMQLAALGLPLSAVAADSRIIADVTLGDDGLPKSISLPLPLQVVKEN